MKRTTSLAAAVTAAAIIVTPVAGQTSAATVAAQPPVGAQAITMPDVESFAPDPLKVLALPFSNVELVRQSHFVVTSYKVDKDTKEYVDVKGERLTEQGDPSRDADYAAYLAKNGVPATSANAFQAFSDVFNKYAAKGDFATAAVLIQDYLNQLASGVQGLPGKLISLNVEAFFSQQQKVANIRSSSSAAPNPFAAPDLGSLLKVAGIPLKNLDQAREAGFVTTGYKKDEDGKYVDKDGEVIEQGDPSNPVYAEYLKTHGDPVKTFIFAALNGVVNVALKGEFAKAASLVQGYLAEFADNVVTLPGDMLAYDLAALNEVFPSIPASLPKEDDQAATSGGASKQATPGTSSRLALTRVSSNSDGDNEGGGTAAGGDRGVVPGSGDAAGVNGGSGNGSGSGLRETITGAIDRLTGAGVTRDDDKAEPTSESPDSPTAEPESEVTGPDTTTETEPSSTVENETTEDGDTK